MSTAEITEPTEQEAVVFLGQESTTSATIMHLQLDTAQEIAGDSDFEKYLDFEARRRGISLHVVRHEEEEAQAKLDRVLLDRTKLYAAAKASPADHPFLHDDDADSPSR